MPPAPVRRTPFVGKLVLAALLAGYAAALHCWPKPVGIGTTAFAIFIAASNGERSRRLRNLAALRRGEEIGTFARALLPHSDGFDPRIVRATWDALIPYVAFRNGRVSLRPDDLLDEDLDIDPEDLDFDLIKSIAARAGRSLVRAESNPMFGKIEKVGHLVQFLEHQPRIG